MTTTPDQAADGALADRLDRLRISGILDNEIYEEILAKNHDQIVAALRAAAQPPAQLRTSPLSRHLRMIAGDIDDHLWAESINEAAEILERSPAQLQGEPVAWLYESWNGGNSWGKHFSLDKPDGNKWQRNIVPLCPTPFDAIAREREPRLRVCDIVEISESAAIDARAAGIDGHKALKDIAKLIGDRSRTASPQDTGERNSGSLLTASRNSDERLPIDKAGSEPETADGDAREALSATKPDIAEIMREAKDIAIMSEPMRAEMHGAVDAYTTKRMLDLIDRQSQSLERLSAELERVRKENGQLRLAIIGGNELGEAATMPLADLLEINAKYVADWQANFDRSVNAEAERDAMKAALLEIAPHLRIHDDASPTRAAAIRNVRTAINGRVR